MGNITPGYNKSCCFQETSRTHSARLAGPMSRRRLAEGRTCGFFPGWLLMGLWGTPRAFPSLPAPSSQGANVSPQGMLKEDTRKKTQPTIFGTLSLEGVQVERPKRPTLQFEDPTCFPWFTNLVSNMGFKLTLVGGFKPFHEKYYSSQIGNLPQIGVKMKNIWNHHLVTCFWVFSLHKTYVFQLPDMKHAYLSPTPSLQCQFWSFSLAFPIPSMYDISILVYHNINQM